MIRVAALSLSLALLGCGDTGSDIVTFPVLGAGAGDDVAEVEGWTVTLTNARLAFGPLYLCPSSFSDRDFCEEAQGELLTPGTIDGLDDAEAMLGTAGAIVGIVRSAQFDYGRTWRIDDGRPVPNDGAVDGEHSLVIAGRAARDATTFDFVARYDIDAQASGLSAIFGFQTFRDIDGTEALVVRVDPTAWFEALEGTSRDELALAAEAANDGEPLELQRGDALYDELELSLINRAPPVFDWVD